jgi:hypothetical protein
MANYTHEAGSNYPEQPLELTEYLDVDSIVADDIATIKKYQAEGKYAEAEQHLAQNHHLKKYIFCSSDINKLAEELRNTQIKALNVAQQLFYQDSSPKDFASTGDVWISDANI